MSPCDPWTVTCQASLSMGFLRQDDWSQLPFPSPGDLLDPGIELESPVTLALQMASPPGKTGVTMAGPLFTK